MGHWDRDGRHLHALSDAPGEPGRPGSLGVWNAVDADHGESGWGEGGVEESDDGDE